MILVVFMNLSNLAPLPLPLSDFAGLCRVSDDIYLEHCLVADFYERCLDQNSCAELFGDGHTRHAAQALLLYLSKLELAGYVVESDGPALAVDGFFYINLFALVNGSRVHALRSRVPTLDGIFRLTETEILESMAFSVSNFCQSLRL